MRWGRAAAATGVVTVEVEMVERILAQIVISRNMQTQSCFLGGHKLAESARPEHERK